MKRNGKSGRSLYLLVVFGLVMALAAFAWARTEKKVSDPVRSGAGVDDPAFLQTIHYLLGPQLLAGNKIVGLRNGDEIFPSMLEAIRQAKSTITFETYIWESGTVGGQLMEAFMNRARAGVRVLVIVDGMGTLKLKDSEMRAMKEAGVEFVKYRREKWYHIHPNLNHRTHRKILIVDGRVGFTGGVCIGDKWLGNAENLEQWRDNHYRIEGPAVGQLQAIFADNWLETTGELLEGPGFFPELKPAGSTYAQCFLSGPDEGREKARIVHLFSIAAARKSIRLGHAYFVPDDLLIQTLIEARKRGVEVEIIVPGHHDSAVGRAASRSRWGDLADAGVRFYQFMPALYHCKVMIVDDLWVSAGSVNFDNRSFRINDEANFNALDPVFAKEQIAWFEEDKRNSRELTAEDLRSRPWYQKTGDFLAGLLRSQL